MKVAITGAAGMLGSAMCPAFRAAGHDVAATDLVPHGDVERLDVRKFADVRSTLRAAAAEMVLHLAAETDLETSERDVDHAYLTNSVGTQHVSLACRELGVPMVYISTAGVFDGTKSDPYTEFDRPNPINVYGNSKYQGELIVQRILPPHFIVRAGWMIGGGHRDHKFVSKVLDQVKAGADVIYAVTDKRGTPTYTEDFARNLIALTATENYGLYHMTCEGEGTRYDVARAIIDHCGLDGVEVRPVTSEHFADSFPAPRPASEAMRNQMLDLIGLNMMRPWRLALGAYLDAAAMAEDVHLKPSRVGAGSSA
jgi:dTDP-4-dehydrorhamnose reductase